MWHTIARKTLGTDNPHPIGIARVGIDHQGPALILRYPLLQKNHRVIKPLQHILPFAIVDYALLARLRHETCCFALS